MRVYFCYSMFCKIDLYVLMNFKLTQSKKLIKYMKTIAKLGYSPVLQKLSFSEFRLLEVFLNGNSGGTTWP